MTSKLDERSERVSRLHALVERDDLELPQFDAPALDTMLAKLHEEQRRRSRLRAAGWALIAGVALVLLVVLLRNLA